MQSFVKVGRREVRELARGHKDRMTEPQTDTSTDNKGCLNTNKVYADIRVGSLETRRQTTVR